MNEDDILRLRRCLGAGDSIEQGKGGASSDSPDQCPAVYHSAFELYGGRRNRLPDCRQASLPASSDERVANLGQDTPQQQRAQPYKAIDGVKNDHNRFATKVDPPQEPEQTKMIAK